MNTHKVLIIILVILGIYANLPRQVSYRLGLFGKTFKGNLSTPSVDVSFSGFSFKRDLSLKEGLDLQGGSDLTFDVDTAKVSPADRSAALEALQSNIERRINYLGVTEPVIQTSQVGGQYRLVVEIAGIKDLNQAISLIGTTAQLDFREVISSPSAEASGSSTITGFKPTGLTGADLVRSDVQFDNKTGAPVVGLTFNDSGAKKFADITARDIGKPLAIFLDNNLVSAPVVNTEIDNGRAIIQGTFTLDEVKQLVTQLNSGALPLPITLVQQTTVGATLGADSVHQSLIAGVVGLVVIALFMIANYGRLGLIADSALILYIIFSLALFRLVPVTMTLAGIAGFILSIGMAVDANILIFERFKEEVRWGHQAQSALDLGFARAWSSIRDSNASSLITCAILFWFGTGSVRGFALTLAVGILVSLFTSINITRTLLGFIYRKNV